MAIKIPSLITAPVQPFSIDEFVQHIRAEPEDYPDGSIQREQINSLLLAAAQWMQHYTGHIIIRGNYRYTFDEFPSNNLTVAIMPVVAVNVFNYIDENGDLIDILPDVDIDLSSDCVVIRHNNSCWPVVKKIFNAITLEIDAGYSDVSRVPEGLKIACFLMAAHLHDNASAVAPVDLKEIPFGVKCHANIYRVNLL